MMRLSEKDYYFKVVDTVSLRGTCDRGRSGAILVKDRRIIATGYVGAPAGLPDCDSAGHTLVEVKNVIKPRVDMLPWKPTSTHCVRTVHAELNAILQCAKFGPPANGSVLYCTMFPCRTCTMALINVGIVGVYSKFDYHRSAESKDMLDEAKIPWVIDNYKVLEYGEEE